MTFEKYWPTACLPGEYDAMDSCDQGRWRGVAQAAYQAGIEAAREDLTIAYMSGYHKDRDSMRADAVKVCEKWHDSLASEPEMLKIAEEIRGLK